MTLVSQIEALRKQRGWTQGDLAARMGVHQTYVQKVEKGSRDPTLRFLEKAAEALGQPFSVQFAAPGPVVRDTTPTPLDAEVEADGVWTGDVARWGLGTSELGYARPPLTERIVVEGAGPGWCAARVVGETPLAVTVDPSGEHPAVRVELWPGDVIVWRPAGDTPPGHGDLVVVADGDGLERRVEVRLVRELDGERWAWPLARPHQAPEVLSEWRVLAVAVEQRRGL